MLNRSFSPFLLIRVLAFIVTTGCQAQTNADAPYQTFNAFNNIAIPYAVHLPEGFDASQTYPAVLAFPSGDMGRADADEMTQRLWSTPAARGQWIVVVPLVPGEDWRTHPNHHALEALLDHVKASYNIRGEGFHLMGYGRKGSEIASTWSHMSRKYFSTFTTVADAPYRTWDTGDLRNLSDEERRQDKQLDLLAIYGDEDQATASDVEAAKDRMNQAGLPYRVEAIAGDDDALASLANGDLLKIMATRLLPR